MANSIPTQSPSNVNFSNLKESLENLQSEFREARKAIEVDFLGAPCRSDEEFKTGQCFDDIKQAQKMLGRVYDLLTLIQTVGGYE